jgi:hypothetical protein
MSKRGRFFLYCNNNHIFPARREVRRFFILNLFLITKYIRL